MMEYIAKFAYVVRDIAHENCMLYLSLDGSEPGSGGTTASALARGYWGVTILYDYSKLSLFDTSKMAWAPIIG